jgi:hypothetical protein
MRSLLVLTYDTRKRGAPFECSPFGRTRSSRLLHHQLLTTQTPWILPEGWRNGTVSTTLVVLIAHSIETHVVKPSSVY